MQKIVSDLNSSENQNFE